LKNKSVPVPSVHIALFGPRWYFLLYGPEAWKSQFASEDGWWITGEERIIAALLSLPVISG